MNDIKNDMNLREAVSRREQKLPPLPDDLNERLMESLSPSKENESHPRFSSLSLWRGRGVRLSLLAIAAGIALLIVFNYGKQQSPQEPLVAQQTVVQQNTPQSQLEPIAEEVQQAEADEQPEEKPARELSEDAPQTVEPTSTEKVEAPRQYFSHRVLDIPSPKDEPFFLASTSYMGSPRGYKNGLAASESEEDAENQLSTKTVSQNRPQVPQIPHRNLTKKERRQVAVLGAIATKRWHIDINSMNTMRYGASTVTPDFYLELRGDTLRSYLPYLGDAQMPTLSPSIGLNFEEPVLSYKEGKSKSNKYTQIDIDVKTREDSYHYVIEIYDSGQSYIRVRSQKRDPISFDGTLVTSN